MLEEAAYVDPGFFYETVAPLLLIGNTSLIAISTLTSEINFYTRLLRMRDKGTGLPLFTSISVQLACKRCIEDGAPANCVHMLHLVPRWQSSDRHLKLKTVMQVRGRWRAYSHRRGAHDRDAGPPGPDRERALGPGLRLEPPDLQVLRPGHHVRAGAPPPGAQRGRVPLHRPGRGRAPERLRHPLGHAPQGPPHGEPARVHAQR